MSQRNCSGWSYILLGVLFGWGVVASPVLGQSIPAVGTENTFDVATWNIEWFGAPNGPSNDELQFRNVLAVVRAAEIDLWAVQEIADEGFFARLLDSLGTSWRGALATESSQQRVGFLYRTAVANVRSVRHILTNFSADFATRPPLQIEADVTIADSTRRITFITVHMKCCGGTSDFEKRLAASGRLKNHIDFGTLHDKPVILLGDFNDELTSSISSGNDTPYRNFLDDPARYQFKSQPLDQANLNTYCSNTSCSSGSTLDHILVTNELFADVESGSTDRFIELTSSIPGYVNNTSDHLPVYARIRYGISTGISEAEPGRLGGLVAFPNPSSDFVTLLTTEEPGGCTSDCRVAVFDITGRRMSVAIDGRSGRQVGAPNSTLDIARNSLVLDVRSLPAGVFFAVVSSETGISTQRFVVVR